MPSDERVVPARLRPSGGVEALEHSLQAAETGTREELARSPVTASRHDGSAVAGQIRRAPGLGTYDEADYS